MSTNQLLLFILGASLLSACRPGNKGNNDTTKEDGRELPALVFEQQTFSRQSASCEQDSNRCARVEAVYPLAVAGPEDAVRRINDTLNAYLRISTAVFAPSVEEIPQTLDAIAGDFLDEYEAVMSEESEYVTSWAVEVEGEILYQSEKMASAQLSTFSYAGGAHPNSFVFLINFDVESGEVLRLPDIIRDTAALRELAEPAFREARELGPDESLSDAGFFWGGPFALPENFAMTEEGLYFFYNPYEVAAYAAGPTEFIISREQLAGLMGEEVRR